jgi:outer membrane protein assembly factor BamB
MFSREARQSNSGNLMKKYAVVVFAVSLCVAFAASGAESWWPQFRGDNASGVSESAKPPADFGPGSNQLWKTRTPPGASSLSIWRDSIFLTAFEGGRLETCCYKRSDGSLLWKRDAQAQAIEDFNAEEGSPATATPATDGKHVVSYFGSCGLICYDVNGKERWRHPLPTAQTTGGFGSGGSPLLARGLVIVNRDQASGCSVLAVDLKNSATAWETQRPDVSQSFGTPIFWKNDGADEIVMAGSLKIKGYDLKTGAERWTLPGVSSFSCTTPVLGDGMLFYAGWAPGKDPGSYPTWEGLAQQADRNHDGVISLEEAKAAGFGSFFKSFDVNGDGKITKEDIDLAKAHLAKGENVLIAVKSGGHGELAADQVVWKQTAGLPYVPSPLFYRGRVYLVRDGGMVSSFDAKTGAPYYQKERLLDAGGNYYASPVAADGRIYFTSLNGRVSVVEAGGDKPAILSHADFHERITATPALVGNSLYLRTASALFAFAQ